ncbi:AAA family ATPase [Enterovibrio norvegicus]|uniref:AAA family ATPase n=1 Tax=Enterovibrio norvegicus TaxID=188144 RepID=UPI00352CBFE2
MLKDLNEIIRKCRGAFDALEYTGDIRIDTELARHLDAALQLVESRSSFRVYPYSIQLLNEKNLRTDISSSWLWYGATFWELVEALNEYQNLVRMLKADLKTKGHSSSDINALLKELPSSTFDFSSDIGSDVQTFIGNELSPSDGLLFETFLTDRNWWIQPLNSSEQTKGKTLDRTDVFQSAFNLAARVIVANSDRLITVVEAFAASSALRDYFSCLRVVPVVIGGVGSSDASDRLDGKNEIYYGAPGTGKSHAIDGLTAHAEKVVTVFHPDTQHSDFVGALKPTMDAGNITYQFRPGPFTKALIEALNHPESPVYLVIEEINRAPAAAVFGELFQLLDRKDGASKYKIDAADPDMLAYINSALSTGVSPISKLTIPANLSLLATMNSSDQAVMPLDTAFKRRWSFRYMKIDFENQDVSDQQFTVMTREGLYKISWRNFAEKVINHLLKELRIPEDRLLGPFFLSANELVDNQAANEALCGKLFVYLWDDVLRHKRNGVIFDDAITTFGDLHERFNGQRLSVFGEPAETLIIQNGVVVNAETPVTGEDGVDA